MTHICTFPDRTAVVVEVEHQSEKQFLVRWTSSKGLISTVWVPKEWVALRVHPINVTV